MLISMLPSFIFDVTSHLIYDVNFVSNLQFSMFPYSILIASIQKDIGKKSASKMLMKLTPWYILFKGRASVVSHNQFINYV